MMAVRHSVRGGSWPGVSAWERSGFRVQPNGESPGQARMTYRRGKRPFSSSRPHRIAPALGSWLGAGELYRPETLQPHSYVGSRDPHRRQAVPQRRLFRGYGPCGLPLRAAWQAVRRPNSGNGARLGVSGASPIPSTAATRCAPRPGDFRDRGGAPMPAPADLTPLPPRSRRPDRRRHLLAYLAEDPIMTTTSAGLPPSIAALIAGLHAAPIDCFDGPTTQAALARS